MSSSLPKSVTFAQLRADGVTCALRSPAGMRLHLTGYLGAVEPLAEGDGPLIANKALVHNLWSFAKNEKLFRRARNDEKRKSYRRAADAHVGAALKIAALVDTRGSERRTGWCSSCLARTQHCRLERDFGKFRAYLCDSCGSPTLGCAAPRCSPMATRGTAAIQVPRYCAEHRHEIPGFEKADRKIGTLAEYEELLRFERRNLARGSRLAIGSALAAGTISTAGLLAAPAIGGAVGTLVGGYTGAAASSYGLALLGGGSLAAGGFGMAGGTGVIAVAGAALGGGLGLGVTSAYLGEDKSFRIETIQEGSGIPVVVVNGFLTEGLDTSDQWRSLVRRTYPDSTIYRVHWGSKELKGVAALLLAGGARQAVKTVSIKWAVRATKAGAERLGPIGAVLAATDLARNPWHTAVVRADRTGVALAGLLARTEEPSYVIVGHSLGGRVAVAAVEALGLRHSPTKIEAIHLLGAAVGKKRDWRPLNDAVRIKVRNYYSTTDKVLRIAYTIGQAGSTAIGLKGIGSKLPKLGTTTSRGWRQVTRTTSRAYTSSSSLPGRVGPRRSVRWRQEDRVSSAQLR